MISHEKILSPEASEFIQALQRKFGPIRSRELAARAERQKDIDSGKLPAFLPQTREIRETEWTVAQVPSDLRDRRVEITGPAEAKMMINALNSGAQVFMADFEDSLSPTWNNILDGQAACFEAVRGTLFFESPSGEGGKAKRYELNKSGPRATLVARPRGWHLEERHFSCDGAPVSASLFDFGLYFFHNAAELLRRGSGPYFYLPKLESHREARLWNDVFNFSQDTLGIPRGSIRATVLIETILAAFEMDEILYELRDHAAGLNAGRWDYIFSIIKKFRNFPEMALPNRAQVTMRVPFMQAYAELLVATCHRRKAHAMGGMSAYIPNRRDPKVNEEAFAQVRADKDREAGMGFDGTWVAHPDLVTVAREAFDRKKDVPHRFSVLDPEKLLNIQIPDSSVTETGIRNNIEVALIYLERWLQGQGAVAIHNLMEDAATAEISRSQLWQWLRAKKMTRDEYERIRDEELRKLEKTVDFADARALLDQLVLGDEFTEFLTIPAYRTLIEKRERS